MLGFNYTVGFPWIVPVLSRSFDGGRERETDRGHPQPASPRCQRPPAGTGNRPGSTAPAAKPPPPIQIPPHPPSIHSGPTTSTLRANPYPEVTDPICRFPLPTFFHRLEAVHLGDLMRISVRASASVQMRYPPTGFSRASLQRPRTGQIRPALRDGL